MVAILPGACPIRGSGRAPSSCEVRIRDGTGTQSAEDDLQGVDLVVGEVVVDIEQMVAARMARHKIYERKPAPTLSFVIEESVLERPFGGADVLRGQLEHMLLVAENPHVEIQVMPTRVTDHAGADGPFTMMTPEGGEQVAYVESQGNGRVIAKRESVRGFAVRYGILRAQALSPAESVRHIEKLLQGDL
ncbi:DUF5753 domain-containing protein [Streptomyces sp. G35A]